MLRESRLVDSYDMLRWCLERRPVCVRAEDADEALMIVRFVIVRFVIVRRPVGLVPRAALFFILPAPIDPCSGYG